MGDFDPKNRSHAATGEAIRHSGEALGSPAEHHWIGTEEVLAADAPQRLDGLGGLWIAPASPYKSMEGALAAIRTARERQIPLLGTCGGFQHMILEYARNVLGFGDAEHEETNPGAKRLFLSRLACSLVGRTMTITLEPRSLLAQLYGCSTVREEYHCNYGVNPECVSALRASGLRIVASDDEGAVRAVELPEHPFFVGTLFLPQHLSTPTSPHPVVSGFVKAASR